jgi:hypothetical protein
MMMVAVDHYTALAVAHPCSHDVSAFICYCAWVEILAKDLQRYVDWN